MVNHATRQWVVLPESARSDKRQIAYLGFDPAVSSSHFHVFELVEKNPANADGEADDGELDATINALEIYSSETGVWSHKDIGWGHQIGVLDDWRSVFFNGMLHLITMGYVVAVVDVEGNSWRTIPMPQTLDDPDCNVDDGFVDLSQGRLYFVNTDRYDLYNSLSVWVLQDYSSDQWTLKHTVSHLHLFGTDKQHFGYDDKVVSIHPKRNIIFLVSLNDGIFISYEMDSREVHYIGELGVVSTLHYLPYVPLYSDSLADGH